MMGSCNSTIEDIRKASKSKVSSPFTSCRGRFIFCFVEGTSPPRLRTACPSNCVNILRYVGSVTRFVHLFQYVVFKYPTSGYVRFFIIVVLCLFASNDRRTIAFTGFILSTTLCISFLCFQGAIRFSIVCFLLRSFITSVPNGRYRSNRRRRAGCGCPRGCRSGFHGNACWFMLFHVFILTVYWVGWGEGVPVVGEGRLVAILV